MGNVNPDKYELSGGIIEQLPDYKTDTTGDIEQTYAIWKILFTSVERAIG
jgi:hypothetical protein